MPGLLQYTPNVQICSQGKELAISEEFLYRLEENNISILEDKIVTLAGEHGLETAQMESGQQIDAQGLFIANSLPWEQICTFGVYCSSSSPWLAAKFPSPTTKTGLPRMKKPSQLTQ